VGKSIAAVEANKNKNGEIFHFCEYAKINPSHMGGKE